MSDCDVAAMDAYMSQDWEPDGRHLELIAQRDKYKAEVAELRKDADGMFAVIEYCLDNGIVVRGKTLDYIMVWREKYGEGEYGNSRV